MTCGAPANTSCLFNGLPILAAPALSSGVVAPATICWLAMRPTALPVPSYSQHLKLTCGHDSGIRSHSRRMLSTNLGSTTNAVKVGWNASPLVRFRYSRRCSREARFIARGAIRSTGESGDQRIETLPLPDGERRPRKHCVVWHISDAEKSRLRAFGFEYGHRTVQRFPLAPCHSNHGRLPAPGVTKRWATTLKQVRDESR